MHYARELELTLARCVRAHHTVRGDTSADISADVSAGKRAGTGQNRRAAAPRRGRPGAG